MNCVIPSPLLDIKELYLERPSRYAHWALGRWFLEAQGLAAAGVYPSKYHLLATEQNVHQCLYLIQLLSLQNLPLELLKAWNLEHSKDPW